MNRKMALLVFTVGEGHERVFGGIREVSPLLIFFWKNLAFDDLHVKAYIILSGKYLPPQQFWLRYAYDEATGADKCNDL